MDKFDSPLPSVDYGSNNLFGFIPDGHSWYKSKPSTSTRLVFSDEIYSIRAFALLLMRHYRSVGCFTIDSIVDRFFAGRLNDEQKEYFKQKLTEWTSYQRDRRLMTAKDYSYVISVWIEIMGRSSMSWHWLPSEIIHVIKKFRIHAAR